MSRWGLLIALFFQLPVNRLNAFQFTSYTSSSTVLFSENKGQFIDQKGATRPEVLFVGKSGNTKLILSSTSLTFQFEQLLGMPGPMMGTYDQQNKEEMMEVATRQVRLSLLGANPKAKVHKEAPASSLSHFYHLTEPGKTVTHVQSFEKITLTNIYPHIDWVVSAERGQVFSQFVLHPEADPAVIQWTFSNTEQERNIPQLTNDDRFVILDDQDIYLDVSSTTHPLVISPCLNGNQPITFNKSINSATVKTLTTTIDL